ncbi:hypothetical protein MSIMFI_01763 [Mycobacterium simulans]|uniref:DUF488 domain-containing protein n=1 Tax=Mycobacterium simulans TaxID=627089 RepID=UPI001748678A|nr:DUF488 domain-containing protein [Mycobacterium simulans]SON60269.1 hypothetical protein MSIMFI_01763 [Mycobacterium simulans]
MSPRVQFLVSIGYQGRTVDELVRHLIDNDVDVLVDVRLTPVSRKPGLSKRQLSAAVAAAGIEYVHHRALGNPRDNRDGFRAGDLESVARFRDAVLSTDDAQRAISQVVELLEGGVVALLCFEREQAECHRHLVVEHVQRRVPKVSVVEV